MTDHNHITRGFTSGCPACEPHLRGFEARRRVEPKAPNLSGFPEVQHRIEDGRFICPGDEHSRCHQYPGCDGEHDFWPCGCEYVSHKECWIKPWIDASALIDSYGGDEHAHLLLDDDFPDGDATTTWEYEYMLWDYAEPRPEARKS